MEISSPNEAGNDVTILKHVKAYKNNPCAGYKMTSCTANHHVTYCASCEHVCSVLGKYHKHAGHTASWCFTMTLLAMLIFFYCSSVFMWTDASKRLSTVALRVRVRLRLDSKPLSCCICRCIFRKPLTTRLDRLRPAASYAGEQILRKHSLILAACVSAARHWLQTPSSACWRHTNSPSILHKYEYVFWGMYWAKCTTITLHWWAERTRKRKVAKRHYQLMKSRYCTGEMT